MRRSADLQRLLTLGLSVPIVALNLWVLSQIFRYFEQPITLLVVAAILAFLLNYAVRFFERANITRTQAVIVVLLLSVTLVIILAVTLVPVVTNQTAQLLSNLPTWLETSQQNLQTWDAWAKARRLPLDLQGFGTNINRQLERQLPTLPGQALGFAWGTVAGLVNTVLVIVLAFYMLLYGDRMWQGLINLLPPKIGMPLHESLRLNLHNFFLSQLLLAGFMVVVLIPVFLALRVPFALLFALLIGIAELIPLVGPTLGIGSVVILIMLQDFWLAVWVAGFAIVIQQIRDNVIAPRLMGNFTGLNPVWIFIAVLMGAQIAGFLGILVAVPIAGTIKGTVEALQNAQRPKIIRTEAGDV